MTGIAGAIGWGMVAGLALALPVGPVALLLLQEGLARGFRVAAGGALGIATVDAAYATVAMLAGGGVGRVLDGHVPLVRVVGAVTLTVMAADGVRRTLTARDGQDGTPVVEARAGTTVADRRCGVGRGAPARAFARFVAITAVNPLTAVAFTAMAVTLGPVLHGTGRAGFVVGVAGASAAWQLALASIGSALGARLGARARTVCALVGNGAVVVLAAAVVLM